MPLKKTKPSQTQTKAGAGALIATVFALVWDTMVYKLVVPARGIPFWFKAAFVAGGLLVTWGALYAWRQRLKGGAASLQLPQDPVPHGVPMPVAFQLARYVEADTWHVEAKIESTTPKQSGFGMIWVQDYPAHCIDGYHVRAQVTLPSDFPSTAASDKETQYKVTLTLKANGVEWAFDLQTRSASSAEARSMPLHGASKLGNLRPSLSPEQLATLRRRWSWVGGAAVALMLYQSASYMLDFSLWSYAKSLLAVGGM